MKRIFLILLLIISATSFAQDETPKRLGFFTSIDANVGFDLGSIIKNNQANDDYERSQLPPGKFNYGISAMVGYQPWKWFAISGGSRYSYIDPNYHLIYWKVEPKFIISDALDEDLGYLFFNFGNKINETAASKAGFVGIGFGKIETLSKRFGHQFQIYLDVQRIDNESPVFVGFSYGIILFSNKNL